MIFNREIRKYTFPWPDDIYIYMNQLVSFIYMYISQYALCSTTAFVTSRWAILCVKLSDSYPVSEVRCGRTPKVMPDYMDWVYGFHGSVLGINMPSFMYMIWHFLIGDYSFIMGSPVLIYRHVYSKASAMRNMISYIIITHAIVNNVGDIFSKPSAYNCYVFREINHCLWSQIYILSW